MTIENSIDKLTAAVDRLVDVIGSGYRPTVTDEAPEPGEDVTLPEAAPTPPKKPRKPAAPPVSDVGMGEGGTLEGAAKVAQEMMRLGHREALVGLLKEHGAPKVAAIAADKLGAFTQAARAKLAELTAEGV